MAYQCMPITSCTVAGHSFIRRLYDVCYMEDSMEHHFNLAQCSTHWIHRGGWTWDRFLTQKTGFKSVAKLHTEVVYFELGGNELDSDMDPYVLCEQALNIAQGLLDNGSSLIILGEVLYRGDTRHIPVQEYNFKVDLYNDGLRDALIDPTLPRNSHHRFIRHNIWFWDHLRLRGAIWDLLDPFDLVHLTDEGLYRLYRSIRLALMHAAIALH